MARISSVRGRLALPERTAAIAALLLALLALGFSGCGNDNPADSGGTIRVDIRGLKEQMGSGFNTLVEGPGVSKATTDVKSLIIGAVAITFTDTALSESTKIDAGIEDKLAKDIINSINYFSIVDLATSGDFVEFKIPPPGAGNWQVAAVGTKNQIVTFNDLNDANVAIYYGFDPQFRTTTKKIPTIEITMNRACFIDVPPKGCASYNIDGTSVVTPTVNILDVYDGNAAVSNRTGLVTTNITSAATGQTILNTVRSNNAAAFTAGKTVTVVTMHQDATAYAAGGCSAGGYSTGSSLATLAANPCIGLFKTKF